MHPETRRHPQRWTREPGKARKAAWHHRERTSLKPSGETRCRATVRSLGQATRGIITSHSDVGFKIQRRAMLRRATTAQQASGRVLREGSHTGGAGPSTAGHLAVATLGPASARAQLAASSVGPSSPPSLSISLSLSLALQPWRHTPRDRAHALRTDRIGRQDSLARLARRVVVPARSPHPSADHEAKSRRDREGGKPRAPPRT